MITPEEIKVKAERCYLAFLQSWMRGEPYVPLRISAGKSPDTFSQLRVEVQQLQAMAKAQRSYGYRIEMRQQQTRSLGMQTRPIAVLFETAEDFLRFIEKEHEFQHFQHDVTHIREQLPQLATWMEQHPKKVIAQHEFWPGLLLVCQYFLRHPQPELYIRELPINVHTKFIEERRGILRELLEVLLPAETILFNALTFQQRFGLREGEPHVHARFLDDQLGKRYGLPLNELSTPCSQFSQLQLEEHCCFITENKMTFLTLPPMPYTFAILGGGFAVSILAAIPWLSHCSIIYWGDLDAQGFQILSQLRSFFPHVVSLMMDKSTFYAFAEFWVVGTPCSVQHIPNLTEEEHMLFTHLVKENRRLEQEHIDHEYALKRIQECFQ